MTGKLKDLMRLAGGEWVISFTTRNDPRKLFDQLNDAEVDVEIKKSSPLMIRLLNAYIVRDMIGDEGFFPLFERDDEITKKAVEVIGDL